MFKRLVTVCAFFASVALHVLAADIAVVAPEDGYHQALARHVQRWLKEQAIASDVVLPKALPSVLPKSRLALLVGCGEPTEAEMKALTAYRTRGGRLIVFYSASQRLAALMGVKQLGYAPAAYPGQWSRMDFTVDFPEGLPKAVPQVSSVLQKAAPLPGRGRVMATWTDRYGRPTGDAAWISTAAGYWMTHVLLSDGDQALKSQLLGALTGCLVPGTWNYAAFKAKAAAEHRALRAIALQQIPRKGEIHAVWDHSGCGLYPGNWKKTMHALQEARVTDLFVNVAGAGFAHYPSSVLPRSKTFLQEGDQLKACLAAAQGTGIRVHAWMLCFTASRSSPEVLAAYQQRGWRLKDRDGKPTEHLDPSQAGVRSLLLRAIDEIQANYRVQGIHLDFVRWYERSAKPANAAAVISSFVAAARQHVRRPAWLTTAVLGKYPMCVTTVGQDWDSWLTANTVDYVVPMDYSDDRSKFESFLRQHAANPAHARRTIVGIGVSANESRLTPRQVIDQINLVRRYNLPGMSLFDLNTTLEDRVFPYLKLGIW